ncbi:RNA polymerase sigma factor [Planctomycetes bacterium CA13]|uniref:RNA polymerase sigma factor n=1 Tax=Novipirellula herctigrandis TaxID=2527986 RepID=A0A5C5Z0D1_9BACT|nr:RNA polymerase sigma factor [Planctomycetes bacterium CA13]
MNQSSQEARYSRFVVLLARNDHSIRRFVRSLLPSRDGVDDVVQDVALECWRKFADFEGDEDDVEKEPDEFIRWACVIARYKVLSHQRDRARDRLVFRESVLHQLATTALDRFDEQNAERQSIDNCLDKMNDDSRRLILSVYEPGDSVTRIANETGQKARRLYTKVNALRRMLLDCLKQQKTNEC